MALSCLTPLPALAAEPLPSKDRPATWGMSLEQLRAIGLGQTRAAPLPVPAKYQRHGDRPPVAHGGSVPPPAVIFVNFDGAVLSSGSDDATADATQIAELVGEFAPYGDDPVKKMAVMQATATDWAAYHIKVVAERPASGEYTMNMTGPTNPYGGGVLGIAPVDCSNLQTHSNITYAFHSADDGHNASTTATTIGQEVAHSYGLEHVDAPMDILNPTNAGGDPSFVDMCLPLAGGSAIAVCPEQHVQHCPDGQGQNSHQELLTIFGPSIPDLEPPVIVITTPLNGDTVAPNETVTVTATITDHSFVPEADLYANGELLQTDIVPPWDWQIAGLPDGIYTLEVVARDVDGNEGLSSPVSLLVGEGPDTDGLDDGSGDGGALDGDATDDHGEDTESDSAGADGDEGDQGCGCTQAPPHRPWLAVAPLLLALGRRRRAG